jgi:hypothetical protein
MNTIVKNVLATCLELKLDNFTPFSFLIQKKHNRKRGKQKSFKVSIDSVACYFTSKNEY